MGQAAIIVGGNVAVAWCAIRAALMWAPWVVGSRRDLVSERLGLLYAFLAWACVWIAAEGLWYAFARVLLHEGIVNLWQVGGVAIWIMRAAMLSIAMMAIVCWWLANGEPLPVIRRRAVLLAVEVAIIWSIVAFALY